MSEESKPTCRHCGGKPSPYFPAGPSCTRCAHDGARAMWKHLRYVQSLELKAIRDAEREAA